MTLSLSLRRGMMLAVLSITGVSLLVAGIYLALPRGVPTRTYAVSAFVLGTRDEVESHARSLSGNASAIMVEGMKLEVKFLNGSIETIWSDGITDMDGITDINAWPNFSIPRCEGELNSTDIVEIHLDFVHTVEIGGEGPIIAVLVTKNYTVHSDLLDETVADLGVLNVSNARQGGVTSMISQPPFFGRDYLAPYDANPEWVCTGFWNDYRGFPKDFPPAWQMNSNQIQSILFNATGSVIISFKMDLSANVEYRSFTSPTNVTSVGSGTAQWSGTWGTFQLLHEGDKLIGLTYNFTNVYLDAILT
jgi:hypothetical protein